MQLKKFEAPTIQEALKQIKAELGDDAVIFDLRTIRSNGAYPKLGGTQWVEVTAALERAFSKTIPAQCFNDKGDKVEKSDIQPFSRQQKLNFDELSATLQENLSMREHEKPFFASNCFPYLKNMLLSGFSHDTAWYLLGEASAEYTKNPLSKSLYTILLQKIACHIPVAEPVSCNGNKRKIIAFIGPTGVGKTTTLAKIAAQFLLDKRTKIKIITLDTYRIAAVEQLKVYGRIMDIPVIAVTTSEELGSELEQHDGSQLILIDTAGRNYRNSEQIAALSYWIQRYADIETHLLLSATTTDDVVYEALQCFSKTRLDRIIITKVDESIRQGHLYNPIVTKKIPVSYITTGQRVPEDIIPASVEMLSGMFLNGFQN